MKECNIDVLEVRQVNRIAELRKKIGLSQSALGEILGVSQQTISKYEKSDLNVPADILAEYSCAMKSHFRKFGNQMSGSGNHLCNYASLLA